MIDDISYTQNNSIESLKSALIMTDITYIVCDMIEENISYVKNNGLTPKAKINRERLMKLLDITETVNSVSTDNMSLKAFNNRLLVENQHLKNTIIELNRQQNMANSL